jgi:branched-chain amino acid transport system ATP-binding protein
LSVHDVRVEIGAVRILDGVDLELARGERRVILGPNGAGKTTLFNVLTGVIRPASCEVRLFAQDISRWAPERRATAGIARTFQVTNLMDSMTVRENVVLALMAHRPQRRDPLRALGRRRILAEAGELLDHWQLGERAEVPVHGLSYGDRRHLEIVLAVASQPSVLLLDEPTAGLSPRDTEAITRLINELDAGISVILIEHDLTVALELADSVTVMTEGRVSVEGDSDSPDVRRALDAIYLGSLAGSLA